MLKIKNLTKVYKSQSKEDVVANDNISLSFAEKGMVFICGKSGSGKTTLLNILAGLDQKTSGEYLIDEKNIDDFRSLDEFRNQCVGFVFQDYNLIDYLSVAENVELALSLQRNVDKDKISQILSEVGLGGYENRKINELSGGQKQRVAIARALVKNSEFILADEPTGNLDTKTSKEIFDLLKKISKSKLVIVVSHSEDLADKYADRKIEIADGKIVFDSKKCRPRKNENTNSTFQAKSLSPKYISKMGFNNIKNHLFKSIISVTLFVLTIFSICVGQLFLSFNAEKSIIKNLNKSQEPLFLAQSVYQENLEHKEVLFDDYTQINESVYESVLNQDVSYLKGYNLNLTEILDKYMEGSFYLTNSKQDLLNVGIEFYSADEITSNGVYLTDYAVDYLLNVGRYKLSDTTTEYENMKGLELQYYDSVVNAYVSKYKICGVIKTDYKDYFNDNFEIKQEYDTKKFNNEETFKNFVNQKKNLEYMPIFVNEEYIKTHLNPSKIDFIGSNIKELSVNISELSKTVDSMSLLSVDSYNYQTIYDGKVVYSNDIVLNDDEVLVNLTLYNALFNEVEYSDLRSYISYDGEGNKLCSYNFRYLGEEISFNQKHAEMNKILFSLEGKKIAGVVIKSYDLITNDAFEIYTSEIFINNNAIFSHINNIVRCKPINQVSLEKVISSSRNNFNIAVKSVLAEAIYALEQTANMVSFIFLGLSVIFVIIAILTTINVISLSINNRKKEIGILRAIGTKQQDIEKMFLFENFITGLTSFVISVILVIVGISVINLILSKSSMVAITFLSANVYCFVIPFMVSFLLSFIACILPLKHINKLNPIDAIKSVN